MELIERTITAEELETEYRARAGRWNVYRDGGHWDGMTGYGFPWAMGTAEWIGRPSFVRSLVVEFIDAEGGEKVTANLK
jgi:hypothetical protein